MADAPKKENRFLIEPHTTADKKFAITGPPDLYLWVDYDDVDHAAVDKEAEKLVGILNAHWPEEVSRG